MLSLTLYCYIYTVCDLFDAIDNAAVSSCHHSMPDDNNEDIC